MISKELLSAVLKEKRVILDYEISISKNEIHYGHIDIEEDGFINIYELAHKCKEQALNLGYILYSTVHGYECYIDSRNFIDNTPVRFLAGSEPEAIFKACQWILTKDSK